MSFWVKEFLFVVWLWSLPQSVSISTVSTNNDVNTNIITKRCDLSITPEREQMDVQARVIDILRTCDSKVLEIAQYWYCWIPVSNVYSGDLKDLDLDESCFYLDPVVSAHIYSWQPIDEAKYHELFDLKLEELEKISPEIVAQIKNSNWIKIAKNKDKTQVSRPFKGYLEILETISQFSSVQRKELLTNKKWVQYLHRFDVILSDWDVDWNLVTFLVDFENQYSNEMHDELKSILSTKTLLASEQ